MTNNTNGNTTPQLTAIDYKKKYKTLKRKLKLLIYEHECFLEELSKAQRKLLKVSRDKSFLLDRLLTHEKFNDSSSDSESTASSESDNEKDTAVRKRKHGSLTPGASPAPTGGVTKQMTYTTVVTDQSGKITEPLRKKAKYLTKVKSSPAMRTVTVQSRGMTREEVERHLDSKQSNRHQQFMSLAAAPSSLPDNIFCNDDSNQDPGEFVGRQRAQIVTMDNTDLVIDLPHRK